MKLLIFFISISVFSNFNKEYTGIIAKKSNYQIKRNSLPNLVNVIKSYEVFESKPYHLFNRNYIGYGHLISKNDNFIQLSQSEAEDLLYKDFYSYYKKIDLAYKNISYQKKLILATLSYNIGPTTIINSDFAKDIELMSVNELKSRYITFCHINGKFHKRLYQRRIKELEVILNIKFIK